MTPQIQEVAARIVKMTKELDTDCVINSEQVVANMIDTAVTPERQYLKAQIIRYGRHDDSCVGSGCCSCGFQTIVKEILK